MNGNALVGERDRADAITRRHERGRPDLSDSAMAGLNSRVACAIADLPESEPPAAETLDERASPLPRALRPNRCSSIPFDWWQDFNVFVIAVLNCHNRII
jgi:hypothetical protein